MPTIQPLLDQKRLDHAKEIIRLYGEQIPAEAQKAILEQKIILGMSPYEAKTAAGGYFFKVDADLSVWPPNADPNVVIAKQATHPDNSKIWLTFETATQFVGEGVAKFTVYFKKGRALKIEKVSEFNK